MLRRFLRKIRDFDVTKKHVFAKAVNIAGVIYQPGEAIPADLPLLVKQKLYKTKFIKDVAEAVDKAAQVAEIVDAIKEDRDFIEDLATELVEEKVVEVADKLQAPKKDAKKKSK